MTQIDSVMCVTGGMLSRQMEIDARSLKLDSVEFQKGQCDWSQEDKGQ